MPSLNIPPVTSYPSQKSNAPHLECAIRFDDYVGGFEVSMDNSGRMKMLDAAEHLVEQIRHPLVVQIHLNDLAQIGIHELHHQIHVLRGGLGIAHDRSHFIRKRASCPQPSPIKRHVHSMHRSGLKPYLKFVQRFLWGERI